MTRKNLENNRAERLSHEPHSLEACEVMVQDIEASVRNLPKDVQVYLDAVRGFVHEKQHDITLRNAGLVWKSVCYYRMYLADAGVSCDDASQEGQLGLMHAAMLFDFRRGVRFSTYAVRWIRQRIRRLLQQNYIVQIPVYLQERSLEREQDAGWQRRWEIGEKMKKVVRLSAMQPPEGDGCPGETMVPDEHNPSRVEALDARIDVTELLRCLDDRYAEVIQLRYLDGLTLEETGERLGVTRERVRQLQAKALERMRWWHEELKKQVKS